MGSRDSWLMASTLVAGCVFLGLEPARAGSTQLPADSMNLRQIEQMEKCDAIKRRYADRARQFSEQAKQIANDADRAERLVPAQYIPTRRWQADYDRALLLNDQSVEISRLSDTAFQRCSETTLTLQRQRQTTRSPRSDANQPKRNQAVPVEAP